MDTEKITNPEHAGHRRRLRERFLRSGRAALADYELLELLLSFGVVRKDTKPPARELLNRFGTLAAVLRQPGHLLAEVPGIGPTGVALLLLVREIMTRSLEVEVESSRKICSPADVSDYVRLAIGPNQNECVLVLCLNSANRLIHKAVITEGTVNQAPVYPREVARLALLHGATAVILVHNHPGGQCRPSAEDLDLTRHLTEALVKLDIQLHDHLIVTPGQVYSITAGRVIDQSHAGS